MTVWDSVSTKGDPIYDDWNNAQNMYVSDDTYGTSSTKDDLEDLGGINFFTLVSPGLYEVIDYMRVLIEAHVNGFGPTTRATISAALSWDDGTTWTNFYSANWDGPTDVEQEVIQPLVSDGTSFGRLWKASEMSHLRVRIKLGKIDSGMTCYIDRVQVGKDSHMATDEGFPGGYTNDTEVVGIGL